MTPSCPHCHATLGVFRNRIRRRHGRQPGAAWYRYLATRFFCPVCGAGLKIVTRPAGYVIYALMISVSAYILFYCLLHPPALLRANPWALIIGPSLIFLPFASALRKWGFRYSCAAEEPASSRLRTEAGPEAGSGNPVGETRR